MLSGRACLSNTTPVYNHMFSIHSHLGGTSDPKCDFRTSIESKSVSQFGLFDKS